MRVIVFDLDGTLVDSLPGIRDATNRTLAEDDGRTLSLDEVRLMVGGGAPRLLELAYEAAGIAQPDGVLGRWSAHYEVTVLTGTTPFPGAHAVLEQLKQQFPLGLCTNKPQQPTETLLDALGLAHFFGSVIGGDALAVKKPDPEHLFAVVHALGGDPRRVVLVGDSPVDVATAKAAGVPAVVLTHGYSRVPHDELGAEHLLHCLDALPPLLREMDLSQRREPEMHRNA